MRSFRPLSIATLAIAIGAAPLVAQDSTRRLASRKPDLELVPGENHFVVTSEDGRLKAQRKAAP